MSIIFKRLLTTKLLDFNKSFNYQSKSFLGVFGVFSS
jgi:hypothetical protein